MQNPTSLKIILAFIFILPQLGFTQLQKSQSKAIDNMIAKSEQAYAKYDDQKALDFAKKASVLALKEQDKEKLAQSYMLMAKILATLEMQKESMAYINKAEKLGYSKKSDIHMSELMEIKTYNYNALGLDKLSLQEQKTILKLLQRNMSVKGLKIKARTLGNIGAYYFANGNSDSTWFYLNEAEKVLKKIPEDQAVLEFPEYYDAKGYVFFEEKMVDSAFFYFNKAYSFKMKHKDALLYVQYFAFGDYYKEINENQKALSYYLKCIDNIKKNNVRNTNYIDVYKNVADLYAELKQPEQEKIYLRKFSVATDSISRLNIKKIDYITNIILKDKTLEQEKNNKKGLFIIIGCLLLCGIIGYFIYRKYFGIKNELITLIEFQKNSNEHISSNSYDELLKLARTGSYNFYPRFQELYPEFHNKLFKINEDLHLSELTLLAYIYLDFQTKEISEITNKSVRTIQNQKNKLRKKLKLSSTENFNLWIKKVLNPTSQLNPNQ